MWGTREMEVRVVPLDVVLFALWAFIGFAYLRLYGFDTLSGGLGIVFGLVYGIVIVRFYIIRGIEKNGEFQLTLRYLAFALPAVIGVVSPLLYFALSQGSAGETQMFSFLALAILAVYVSRISLISNWERKQKRQIWNREFWAVDLYASPEPEKK
jgi:hypothetical protein